MNDKKERNVIKTPKLEIDENVMKYESTVVQMSNVTRCEVAPMPKRQYPTWTIIGVVIGIILFFNKTFALALVVCAVCGGILAYIYYSNQNLGTYLIFELNSGQILLFSCDNKRFLMDAQRAVVDCFNDRGSSCIINFQSCVINNSQIGKNNEVNGVNHVSGN